MEIFLSLKNLFRAFAIIQDPNKKIQNICKNVVSTTMAATLATAMFCYLYYEANEFLEYFEPFFYFCAYFFTSVEYCVLLHERKNILELIANIESKVNERILIRRDDTKSGLYQIANDKVEGLTQKLSTVGFKIVTPSFCVPLLLLSYYSYYKTDAAENSFLPVYAASYVCFILFVDFLIDRQYVWF